MPDLAGELAEELRDGIERHGLGAASDVILANAAECYAMVVDDVDGYEEVGNTRFGGDPDLPASVAWPCTGAPDDPEAKFSNFIAQINFAELPPLPSGSPLPRSGVLFLFVREMECAADPVLLDAVYFDGDPSTLQRTFPPDPDRLADEYLVDLEPVRVRGVPAVSLASYRKAFREQVKTLAGTEDDKFSDIATRHYELEASLQRPGQIGQMLGFATSGDVRDNLYRQAFLGRIGRRQMIYRDYWSSMEEYEAYMQKWRDRGDDHLVKNYESMRDGVSWLVANGEMISKGAAELRLLFRLDSNADMDLNMMDADPLYVFVREGDLAKRDFSDLAGEVTQG